MSQAQTSQPPVGTFTTLLDLPQVLQRVPMKRTTLFAEVAAGRFPKPLHLSPRRRAWPAEAVQAWIDAKIAEAAQ